MEPYSDRPAWRGQWILMIVVAFLLLLALATTPGLSGEPGERILAAGLWLAMLGSLLLLLYRHYAWKYEIDETRVSRHYGIVSRNQQSVRIRDIRSVELNQTLFQRIFNIGDLLFYSAGSAAAEVEFRGVRDPAGVRDLVDQAMDSQTAVD